MLSPNLQYRAAWSRFWSGSDANGDKGFKSGIDTTVIKISSKLSVELDMLKRRQLKIQPNNVTIVEEVSIAAKNDSGVVDGVQRLENECSKSITNESTVNNMVQEENNEHKSSITQQRERQLIVSLCDKERAIAAQV